MPRHQIWTPQALPDTRITDGRPMWEPPLFDYTHLIGEVFVKKREAVLAHTGRNAARTTAIMDIITMYELTDLHRDWARDVLKAFDTTGENQDATSFSWSMYKEIEKDWQDESRVIEHLDVVIVLDEEDGGEEDQYLAMSYQEYRNYETLKARRVLEENYSGDQYDYTTCPDKCIIVDQDKHGKWVEMTYKEHRKLYNKDWKETMDKSRYAAPKVQKVDRPYREQDENGEWVDMTYQEYREWQKKDIQPMSYKKRLEARQKAAAAAAELANNEEPPQKDDNKPPPPEPELQTQTIEETPDIALDIPPTQPTATDAHPEYPQATNLGHLWRMRNAPATLMSQGLSAFSSIQHTDSPKKGPLAFQLVMLSNSKNMAEIWHATFGNQELD